MKPVTTDTDDVSHRYRNLVPLTGDRTILHLVPALALSLQPAPDDSTLVEHRRHPHPGARPVDLRNDVIVARHTVADLIDRRVVLGDCGDRGIDSILTSRCDKTGPIIHDHYQAHRRIRAPVKHVIARLKDWQLLCQCRRRGKAINHGLQLIAGLWNLKTRNQLRSPFSEPCRGARTAAHA